MSGKLAKSLLKPLKNGKVLLFALGFALGLISDALSIPTKFVQLTDSFEKARIIVYDVVYSPSDWSGIFDRNPEGIVDHNDFEISSPVGAALEIIVVDSNLIDGRVWWDGACDLGSPYGGLLIEGRIRVGGRSANVTIWDIKDGKKITFLEGILRRDGFIVEFSNFPNWSNLNNSRIARNPEPASIEPRPSLYCDQFLKQFQE